MSRTPSIIEHTSRTPSIIAHFQRQVNYQLKRRVGLCWRHWRVCVSHHTHLCKLTADSCGASRKLPINVCNVPEDLGIRLAYESWVSVCLEYPTSNPVVRTFVQTHE